MNVAHLIPWLSFGGSEKSVFDLCRHGKGSHTIVVPRDGPVRPMFENAGIPVRVAGSFATLVRFLSEADLVHVHWLQFMADIMTAVLQAGKPVLFSIRWPTAFPVLPGIVVCNSQFTYDLQKQNQDRRVLILNGIDPTLFVPPACRPAQPIRIIRICRHTRCDEYFWPAIFKVVSECPNAEVALVGCAPFQIGRMTGLGYRTDIAPLLADAHIFAYTPRPGEGTLDKAPLEAMSAGLPCAASDVPCVNEAVQHGITGLLSPFGDIQAFASNLIRLVREPALREAMGRRGVQVVRERFDIRERMSRYDEMYDRTISENQLPNELELWRNRYRFPAP